MDSGVDFDLLLHQPNGSIIDSSGNFNDADEFVTSLDSSFENQAGTYYVNVSHYAGSGNYSMDVWTNYSVPIPNLAVDNVTFNQAANPGDVVPFDVTVINDGTLDLSDAFMAEIILSVDIEMLGSTTISVTLHGLMDWQLMPLKCLLSMAQYLQISLKENTMFSSS